MFQVTKPLKRQLGGKGGSGLSDGFMRHSANRLDCYYWFLRNRPELSPTRRRPQLYWLLGWTVVDQKALQAVPAIRDNDILSHVN